MNPANNTGPAAGGLTTTHNIYSYPNLADLQAGNNETQLFKTQTVTVTVAAVILNMVMVLVVHMFWI